jgi:alkanesulfonate monooxygenase SsuD/methylene tetrahydromethanopterin reductase-like flavin-dependent oxidoreductase (luciferase family)
MRFGVTHGDAQYAIQPRVETMQSHMTAIRAAAKSAGSAHEPRVFFGIQPFVGGTEEEAQQTYEELRGNVPLELSVSRLSGPVGVDLTQFDLDTPLDRFSTQAGQGLLAALQRSLEGRAPTIREAALQYGMSCGIPQFVGAPEQVADWIEQLWSTVGCYGFGISSNVNPGSMDAFVDHVVPILQKRGLTRRSYAGTTFRENLLQEEG